MLLFKPGEWDVTERPPGGIRPGPCGSTEQRARQAVPPQCKSCTGTSLPRQRHPRTVRRRRPRRVNSVSALNIRNLRSLSTTKSQWILSSRFPVRCFLQCKIAFNNVILRHFGFCVQLQVGLKNWTRTHGLLRLL